MQIFKDKKFVTGIEYRDPKTGEPRDGSIIIKDSSPEAQSILAGQDFDIKDGKIIVKQEKTEEGKRAEKLRTREEKRAQKRAQVIQMVIDKRKNKQAMTLAELQDVVEVLVNAVINPDDE